MVKLAIFAWVAIAGIEVVVKPFAGFVMGLFGA